MFVLNKKLKILKSRLKEWNKNNFGNVQLKVIEAEKVLKEIQTDIGLSGYNDSLHDKEAKAQHALEIALTLEEYFWRESP